MKAAPIPKNDAERVQALRRYAVLDTPPERIFDDVAKLAAHVFGVPIALISLVDADRQWFKARYGLASPQTPRDVSFCGHVVAERKVLLVPDADADDRFADNPLVTGEPHVRFYAGAPLHTPDGHVLGTLCTIDHVARQASPAQMEILQILAQQVVDILELRRQANVVRSYKRLFDSCSGLPCVVGYDGFLKQFNASWSNLLGHDSQVLLSRPFGQFIHPDDRGAAAAALRGISHGETLNALDCRVACADGSYRWLSWQATPDPQEQLIYAIGTDVTDRKHIEQLKSEFVSVVSHELRTPLTSIRGSLRLLDGGVMGAMPDGARDLVHMASSNCERLIRLINHMLDLDRIEAGKLEIRPRMCALPALIQQAVSDVDGMARIAQVRLCSRAEAAAMVFVDPDPIVQVLVNLLSNAIKYSPAGGEVSISASAGEAGRLRLAVTDRGPGIARQDFKRLFGKFEQLDSSDNRKQPGSGLGLAISRAIVELHGGTMGVESQLGHGATFWFEVRTSGTASPSNAPVSRPRREAGRPRVLIIEDDADFRTLTAQMLDRIGADHRSAATYEQATTVTASFAPALIILDVGLPELDGFAVVGRLRQTPARDTPLIVYTGRDLSRRDRGLLRLGVTRFLTKSRVTEASFLAAVEDLLGDPCAEEC